jgi:hypothetical protein
MVGRMFGGFVEGRKDNGQLQRSAFRTWGRAFGTQPGRKACARGFVRSLHHIHPQPVTKRRSAAEVCNFVAKRRLSKSEVSAAVS